MVRHCNLLAGISLVEPPDQSPPACAQMFILAPFLFYFGHQKREHIIMSPTIAQFVFLGARVR